MKDEKGSTSKEIDLSNVRYIISDWDGTLVDSMAQYTRAFSAVLNEEYGIPEEQSGHFFNFESGGMALSYQMKESAKRFAEVDVKDSLPLEDKFWSKLEDIEPEMIDGARTLLEEAKKSGYKFIVWSGSKTEVLIRIAQRLGIDKYIDFIIGNEPGSETMTKGNGLLNVIAKQFGLKPEDLASQSIVIGDMLGDIEAGREIGAITVGFGDPKAEKFKNADFVVQTHQELLDKLKG